MLAARLNVSNTILWFLAFVSSAIADPVCDPIYGQPTYTDCSDLVLALYDSWPGQIPDRKEHYFSLSGEEPSPWIDPELRRLRIYLPKFVFQGGCKLAMTSILLRNGSTTSDSTYWHDIWLNARSTLAHCVDLPPGDGGYHHVGSLNRLILTLYAPGSVYDRQISTIVHRGGTVCSKEATSNDALAGGSEDISGSISCGSAINLVMQEPTSECCNASTSQNQSVKRGNETFCFSCGAGLEAYS